MWKGELICTPKLYGTQEKEDITKDVDTAANKETVDRRHENLEIHGRDMT